MPKRKTIEERFWLYVNPEPNTGCWLWDGYLDGRGYGRLGKGGRSGGLIGAHRFSWELCNGSIPEGLSVLHKCDIPICVNPEHLFIGTQQDNIDDMIKKGRHLEGRRRSAIKRTGVKKPESAIRRGENHPMFGKRKMICKNGHDLTNQHNVFMGTDGARRCLICHKKRSLVSHYKAKLKGGKL